MRGKLSKSKTAIYNTAFKKQIFEGSLVLTAGSWFDPVRRPLDNMVSNGVMLVGDAASLVNPIHGGGIGPQCSSGYFAGQQSQKHYQMANLPKKRSGLQKNTLKPNGKKQGTLDIFKMFPAPCSDEDLNYGMKRETHDRRRRNSSRHGRRLPPKHH